MSSRFSSSSPEPEIAAKKSNKSVDTQAKRKSTAAGHAGEDARNEGDNTDLNYTPPEGYMLMEHKLDEGDYDWDAINNDDNLELWLVRVPEGLKPKYLENLKLEGSSISKTSRVGSLDRKSTTYDVWALGEDGTESVGGDELFNVSCLLPRSKKEGKLYQAAKSISRRLVISARATLPTPPQSSPEPSITIHQNPPRPRYSPDLLTHRFMPLGSMARIDDSADMDVDPDPPADTTVKHSKHRHAEKNEEGAKKRRKGEGDAVKRHKKAKS